MRKPHTNKLTIPNPDKFNEVVDIYQRMYGMIPVKIDTIGGIVGYVTGSNVECIFTNLEGRAYVYPIGGSQLFEILVNEETPYLVQRADIAHELGHILHTFLLTENRMENTTKGKSDLEKLLEERVCDQIGAELLCPDWAIEKLVRKWRKENSTKTNSQLLSHLSRELQFPEVELEAHLIRQYGGLSFDKPVKEAKEVKT